MKKTTYIILAVIILLIIGAVVLYQKKANYTQPANQTTTTQTGADFSEPAESGERTEEKIITKTDAGFSPNSITIKKGETVIWKNQSTGAFWPASAMHPTHTAYDGTALSEHCPDTAKTAFDACQGIATGGSWSFTFEKTGSWKYHDHLNPGHFGTVSVE